MDIVRFKGGLGNQMFQYAFIEALRSRRREVKASLGFYRNHPDLRPFVLDKAFGNVCLDDVKDEVFNEIDEKWKDIKRNPVLLESFKKNIKERFFWVEEGDSIYENRVFETSDCTFVGYWQTEKYFSSIREKLLDCFRFQVHEDKLMCLGEKVKSNYIGVHIRRGDFLEADQHNVCTLEYYEKAILHMKQVYADAKFIFFSDDVGWVKYNFDEKEMLVCEKKFFDCHEDWYDMYLMTLCRGNIISNSSFSWWGAWLNQCKNKIVVSPKIWLNGAATPDIWCDGWVKL